MALLFVDGFDSYANTTDFYRNWIQGTLNVTVLPTGGRRGGGAVRFASAGYETPRVFNTTSSFVFGTAVYSNITGITDVLYFEDIDGVIQLSIRLNPVSGLIYLYRGTSTLLATSSVVPAFLNTWGYLEIKATISTSISANSCIIRWNGIEIINLAAGTSTQASAKSSVSKLAPVYTHIIDDLYMCDQSGTTNNNFLGDCRIDVVRPSADGTYTQGTPSTGTSHYQTVDETTPSTTDYVSLPVTTTPLRDSYQLSDISLISTYSVYGVQATALVTKPDSGVARSAAPFIRANGVNVDGTPVVLGTSYVNIFSVADTVPGTSAAWTFSDVNALEAGVVAAPV